MEEFKSGSVPVAVAARVYGKDASWVRAGIIEGWLPIGAATRRGKLVTDVKAMGDLCTKAVITGDEVTTTFTNDILGKKVLVRISEIKE